MANTGITVSIVISARNRPEELARTLQELRKQTYAPIELIVVDDASDSALEPLVRAEFPGATVCRNEENMGLIASRSAAMTRAKGGYICSLDDDSCFTQPDDLERAVRRMEEEARVGILTFSVVTGPALVQEARAPGAERYIHTFVGCGHMIRRSVIEDIGGYMDRYFYYGEEGEYSLRALGAGWRILFFPSVVVHHRVSQTGRSSGRILRYSFRNDLWTLVLRLPWSRVFLEGSWRLGLYVVECVRVFRPAAAVWGLGSFFWGLPHVLRSRSPVSQRTLRVFDALRFRTVVTEEEYKRARRPSTGEIWQWFLGTWRRRPKAPSFWTTLLHRMLCRAKHSDTSAGQ